MLELNCNNRQLSQLVQDDYRYFDRNMFGNTNQYIGSTYTADALLPLVINEIPMSQVSYQLTDTDYVLHFENFITARHNALSNNTLDIVRVYYNNHIESQVIYDIVLKEDYEVMPEVVDALYNKSFEQMLARCEFNFPDQPQFKAFVSKTKHSIILVTNTRDVAQASDQYLTYGLIPVLFKDYADMLCPEEITYFKTLVSRSQVKRIANVNVKTAYEEMLMVEKYRNCLNLQQRKLILNDIIRNRRSSIANSLRQAQNESENAIRTYEAKIKDMNFFSKQLAEFEQDAEGVTKSYEQALSMKEITYLNRVGNDRLYITFKDTIRFYDPEEAELAIKHRNLSNPMIRMIKDTFVDGKYKMHVASTFCFYTSNNPSNNTDVSIRDESWNYFKERYGAMYNPHIQFYACTGNYRPDLIKARADQDIMLFNTLALASTRSINFTDGAVMDRWFNNLDSIYNGRDYMDGYDMLDIKCLEDVETGDMLTMREYINRISRTQPQLQPEEDDDL